MNILNQFKIRFLREWRLYKTTGQDDFYECNYKGQRYIIADANPAAIVADDVGRTDHEINILIWLIGKLKHVKTI